MRSYSSNYFIATTATAFCLLGFPLAQPSMAQHSASFRSLGDLEGGHDWSAVFATSADGSVIVGSSHSAYGYEPCRWTSDEGLTGLGDLWGVGILRGNANGVSADGKVVVGWSRSGVDPSYNEAFRWTEADGMVGLGDIADGTPDSNALDVSANGSTVVGNATNSLGGKVAVRWDANKGRFPLGYLTIEPSSSWAQAVSANGRVVVGTSLSVSALQAFRWTKREGMIGLGDLPGGVFESRALAVSANGQVIVGFGSTLYGQRAFRWTRRTGMVELGVPESGFESNALAVSSNGAVIVGTGNTCGPPTREAFVWDRVNGMCLLKDVLADDFGLDLSSWRLSAATDVSPDGSTIVGNGTNPIGKYEAWVASVPRFTRGTDH